MPDGQIRKHLLPPLLVEIADLTSAEAALQIARIWGGKDLYLPAKLTPGHKLERAIGRKAAVALCAHYQAEHRQVLRIPTARIYLRWAEARGLRAQGLTTVAIGQRMGMTPRRVEQLLDGYDAPDVCRAAGHDDAQPEICPACQRRLRRRAPDEPDTRQGRLPGL